MTIDDLISALARAKFKIGGTTEVKIQVTSRSDTILVPIDYSDNSDPFVISGYGRGYYINFLDDERDEEPIDDGEIPF